MSKKSRSVAAKKAWVTRRANAAKRSEAAKKAHQTRRRNAAKKTKKKQLRRKKKTSS